MRKNFRRTRKKIWKGKKEQRGEEQDDKEWRNKARTRVIIIVWERNLNEQGNAKERTKTSTIKGLRLTWQKKLRKKTNV